MEFAKQVEGIYRLKVPFEDLYTSVFLLKTDCGNMLVDCATYDSDIDKYVVPALQKLGLCLTDLNYLVVTHCHCDHAGGKNRILELVPNVKIVDKSIDNILNCLTVCELKGHTLDCIGVFDERTKTLISADALQGAGVGKYRCSLENKQEYLKTIEKISKDKRIKNILFSHAYEPWNLDVAIGRKEVEKCLGYCKEYAIK